MTLDFLVLGCVALASAPLDVRELQAAIHAQTGETYSLSVLRDTADGLCANGKISRVCGGWALPPNPPAHPAWREAVLAYANKHARGLDALVLRAAAEYVHTEEGYRVALGVVGVKPHSGVVAHVYALIGVSCDPA